MGSGISELIKKKNKKKIHDLNHKKITVKKKKQTNKETKKQNKQNKREQSTYNFDRWAELIRWNDVNVTRLAIESIQSPPSTKSTQRNRQNKNKTR